MNALRQSLSGLPLASGPPCCSALVCHQILPESFRKSRNTVRDGISSAFMALWAAVGRRREPRPVV
jgi:hypothetical protein